MILPAFGTSIVYQELALFLTNNFNCYGLDYPDFQNERIRTIENIGKSFISQIQEQPMKEYTILVYSMGEYIALETAKRLESIGSKVNIILIDTYINISEDSERDSIKLRLDVEFIGNDNSDIDDREEKKTI